MMAYCIWPHSLSGGTALLLVVVTGVTAQSPHASRSSGEHGPASVNGCVTGDSLLDSPVTRDLLRLLWVHSNPEGRPRERRERAGVLFDSAGSLVHRADLDNPNDTPCRCSCLVPIAGRPLAVVMTHPFRPGEPLPAECSPSDGRLRQYDVSRLGGPSEADLRALELWGVPGYIVDQLHIYAIPRGASMENARSVVKRYLRIDPLTGCTTM